MISGMLLAVLLLGAYVSCVLREEKAFFPCSRFFHCECRSTNIQNPFDTGLQMVCTFPNQHKLTDKNRFETTIRNKMVLNNGISRENSNKK